MRPYSREEIPKAYTSLFDYDGSSASSRGGDENSAPLLDNINEHLDLMRSQFSSMSDFALFDDELPTAA